MRRALCISCAALLFFGWAAALLLPPRGAVGAAAERYVCEWGGTRTEESYASAYASLAGARAEGVLLERGTEQGVIAPSAAYRTLYAALEGDDFAGLLAASAQGLTRIERAAVWRTYSARLWYAGEWFSWTGAGVERTELSAHADGRTVVLFSEPPAPDVLAELGTVSLDCRGGHAPRAEDLIGTRIGELRVSAPYACTEGVLTLETAGGRRIVCGVPAATALVLPDADFADEGALLPCRVLTEVTVPFVGSAKSGRGGSFRGEFAHLFSTGSRYDVPATLKKVTVTGGTLVSYAFYACPSVEEIVACGVAAENVSESAFLGCGGLRVLHAPRRDLLLTGRFSAQTLPCGCTLFVRTD